MASKIYKDIKSLDGKIFKIQFSIINEITKKSITNQYSNEEINEFLRDAKLEEKFEKIVYVNLVNTIKSYDLVLKILLSGDDQMISDALRKCIFFFSDPKFTPEFYIEKVYPKISYSNRNKLLQTLSENSTKSRNEEFYKILNKTYNRETAIIFLPYCGDEFIFEKLQSQIIIDSRNLLKLYKRNSKLVIRYLQEIAKIAKAQESYGKYDLRDYKELIHVIISHHVNEFIDLAEDVKEKCSFLGNCGKRLTKRIIKTKKSVIIADPPHYTCILKSSQIHRYLKPDEFEIFYLGLMPKKLTDFESSLDRGTLETHLNYYKSEEKQKNLLFNAYLKTFNKNLLADLSNITPKIMALLSTEERIKYVNEKIEKEGDKHLTPIKWMKFLPAAQSIKKYREEIYITSDQTKRYELIDLMIQSCGINKDYDAALKVLQYFNQRHRNEGKSARDHLLSAVEHSLDLNYFNESHWKEIYDVFDIISLNDEFRYYSYMVRQVFLKCVEFTLKNNLDLTKPLTYYIKWAIHSYDANKYELFKTNSAWSKLCLLKICELMPIIYTGDELNPSKTFDLCSSICEWNKKNVNEEQLSIVNCEWAVKLIDKLFADNDEQYKSFFKYLKYDKRADMLYKSKLTKEQNFDIYDLKNMLISNKEIVKLCMTKISEYCLQSYYAENYIEPYIKKLFGIEGMEEHIKTYCKKILDETENSSRPEALRFMVKRNWITNKEFYDLAREYYPKGKRQELGESKAEKFVQFQIALIYCLKKFKHDPESLKMIKLFCQGDYLKMSIGTLYHLATKLPNDKIIDFLSTCIDTPVSFKKHIIRLKCLISNRQECIVFLRELWKNETNPSIRQILIQLIIDIFFGENSEHSDFLWECLESLTLKDKLIVEDLYKRVSTIPKDIRGQYLEHCWPLICKIRLADSEFKDFKSNFLTALNENIELLSSTFVENLLKENLFKLNIEFDQIFAREVAVNYIVKDNANEEQLKRFNFILELMKLAIDADWNSLNSVERQIDSFDEYMRLYYPLRDLVQQFCIAFCNKTIQEDNSLYLNLLLVELDTKLHSLLKDPEVYIYNSYWNIQFSILFIKCNKNYEQFGEQFKELIKKAVTKNRYALLTNFLNVLTTFTTSNFHQNNKPKANKIAFVNGLLTEPITEENALIGINLLTINELKKVQHKERLERLTAMNNHTINTELNYFE